MPVAVEAVDRLAMSSEPDKPPESEGLPPWIPERRTNAVIRKPAELRGPIGRKLNIKLNSETLTPYNPSGPIVLELIEYFAVGGKQFMLTRADVNGTEVSSVVTVIERKGYDDWQELDGITPFKDAEDPRLNWIDGQIMLNFIRVTNPVEVRRGKRVRFHEEFHTTRNLRDFQLFATGPQNMKDIPIGQREGSREVEGLNRLQRQEMDPPPEVDELIDYLKFLRAPHDPLIEKRLGQWDNGRVTQVKQIVGSGVILSKQPGELVDLIISKLNYLSNLNDGTREGKERVNNVLKLIGDARQSRDLDQFIKDNEVVVLYEQGGLGKIGYFKLPSSEYLKDPQNIINGRIMEGLLPEGSWGGGGAIRFKGRRLEIVGHDAEEENKDTDEWMKIYDGIGFVYDPGYHLWTPIEGLLTRTNFPAGPSKITDPSKPHFLDRIVFLSAMSEAEEAGKINLWGGFGDANGGTAIIPDPFPRHHQMLDAWINGSSKPLVAQAV